MQELHIQQRAENYGCSLYNVLRFDCTLNSIDTKWREENKSSACPQLFESMINGISHIKFSSTMLIKVSISFFFFFAVIKGHVRADRFLWLFMLFTSDRDWNHSWPVRRSSLRQFKWMLRLQQWLEFNFCCTYTLCGIFCEIHWRFKDWMLPVGTFPWFVWFDLPCLKHFKVSLRVRNT